MVPSRPTAGPPPLVSVEIRQARFEDWAPTMGVRPCRSGPFMNIDHWPGGRGASLWAEKLVRAVAPVDENAGTDLVATSWKMAATRPMKNMRRVNRPPVSFRNLLYLSAKDGLSQCRGTFH